MQGFKMEVETRTRQPHVSPILNSGGVNKTVNMTCYLL